MVVVRFGREHETKVFKSCSRNLAKAIAMDCEQANNLLALLLRQCFGSSSKLLTQLNRSLNVEMNTQHLMLGYFFAKE